MANEPTTTVTGNLTADPEIRFTSSGVPVASFTIANTPRIKTTTGWTDRETWFVRCSAWRDLAENITESLTRGAAVVAAGRLTSRTYDTTDKTTGQPVKRTVVEMTVDDIGPSLRRATARPVKTTREHTQPGGTPLTDPWATGQPAPAGDGGFSDDPPF
jgi:single-strand DNA-binding protein